MTPRVDVVALSSSATAADLLATARSSGFSRFPVFGEDLDAITGVAHIKHAYGVDAHARASVRLQTIMVEAERVPSTLNCESLLHTLRRGSLQLAVVIDEFGGTAGVVTVEDLVEEITGQIRDEYDLGEAPEVIRLHDGSYSVSGRLHRDQFDEAFGWPRVTGPFDTLAGFLLAELGHLPDAGEQLELYGWTVTVERMDGHRIDRVIATPPPTDDGQVDS